MPAARDPGDNGCSAPPQTACAAGLAPPLRRPAGKGQMTAMRADLAPSGEALRTILGNAGPALSGPRRIQVTMESAGQGRFEGRARAVQLQLVGGHP